MDNDLISRSALLKDREYCDCPSCEDGGYCGVCYIPVEAVKNAPAVDAVEVVRCKECKHEENCMKQLVFWERDHVLEQNVYQYHKLDFCSYGERREDDGQ